MEKIKKHKTYWRTYGPLVMWLEDLTEIIAFLQESAKNIEISTEDYRFSTLDELKQHVGSRTQFNLALMTDANPHVTIDFNQHKPRLYVAGDAAQATHLYHELNSLLSRCQRSFPWMYSLRFAIILAFVVLTAEYFVYWRAFASIAPQIFTALLAVVGPLVVWVSFVKLRRVCVIRMQRRADRPPFFERNRDQLVVLLIGALLGGGVTFATGMVKEHFYPSCSTATTPAKSP